MPTVQEEEEEAIASSQMSSARLRFVCLVDEVAVLEEVAGTTTLVSRVCALNFAIGSSDTSRCILSGRVAQGMCGQSLRCDVAMNRTRSINGHGRSSYSVGAYVNYRQSHTDNTQYPHECSQISTGCYGNKSDESMEVVRERAGDHSLFTHRLSSMKFPNNGCVCLNGRKTKHNVRSEI